jgi:hypothetical protein
MSTLDWLNIIVGRKMLPICGQRFRFIAHNQKKQLFINLTSQLIILHISRLRLDVIVFCAHELEIDQENTWH